MRKLLALLTVLVLVATSHGTIYELTITTQPALDYTTLELHQGATNPISLSTNPTHNVRIIDVFEDEVYQKNYSVQEYISYNCLTEECNDTIEFIEEPQLQIRLPYYINAKEIVVQEIGTEQKLRIDVSHLSKYCGNGICNQGYSAETCPQDCLTVIPEEKQSDQKRALYWILFATILAIIGLVYRRRH